MLAVTTIDPPQLITMKLLMPLECIIHRAEELLSESCGKLNRLQREDLTAVYESALSLAEQIQQIDPADLEAINRAAHNLRAPFSSIMGFSQTMLLYPDIYEGHRLNAKQRVRMRDILDAGSQLYNAVCNLVDYARIVLETLEVNFLYYPFAPLAERLIKDAQAWCAARGLNFELDLPQEMPMLIGDQYRTMQALTNILINAVSYTPDGSVGLHITPMGNLLHIAISDTGVSIPPDDREVIFEPFHSVGGAPHSLGLGLFVARTALEMQGGCLWAEARHNGGTIFHIQLPIAEAE